MEEIKTAKQIVEVIVTSWIFKLIVTITITAITGWVINSVKNTSNKIKQAPSKDDLKRGIDSAKRYTDTQIGVHEKDHALIEQKFKEIKEDTARIEKNQQDMNGKLDTLILQLANK